MSGGGLEEGGREARRVIRPVVPGKFRSPLLTNVHYGRLVRRLPELTCSGAVREAEREEGGGGALAGRWEGGRERGRRRGGDDAPFRGTQGPRRVTNCNHGQQSATDALPNSALRWKALFFADREAALSRLHIDSSTHFIWTRSF